MKEIITKTRARNAFGIKSTYIPPPDLKAFEPNPTLYRVDVSKEREEVHIEPTNYYPGILVFGKEDLIKMLRLVDNG